MEGALRKYKLADPLLRLRGGLELGSILRS
jgi:hypothetical protein